MLLECKILFCHTCTYKFFKKYTGCKHTIFLYRLGFKILTGCHISNWRASRNAHILGNLECNSKHKNIRYKDENNLDCNVDNKRQYPPHFKRISDLHLMRKWFFRAFPRSRPKLTLKQRERNHCWQQSPGSLFYIKQITTAYPMNFLSSLKARMYSYVHFLHFIFFLTFKKIQIVLVHNEQCVNEGNNQLNHILE